MSRALWLALLVGLAAGAGVTADVAGDQSRDPIVQPTTGTASITGMVVDDEDPARPVRRAVVTLTGAGLRPNRGAITDDEGRFTLRDLPAGRFRLTAERAGFVTSIYGAKRPGRPGTDLVLSAGQRLVDLRLRLWRGAVLAGTIVSEAGRPLANTTVSAIPAREVTPAALTLSNNAQATTNEIGEFRIFGLEPGTYLVRAGTAQAGRVEVAASAADIDAAFAALAARGARPIAIATPPGRGGEISGTRVTTAPIYYPGTPVPAAATPITLVAGEERSNLNFTVTRVGAATIRGAVMMASGGATSRVFVQLSANAGPMPFASTVPAPISVNAGADGSFQFGPVSPGEYRILARGAAPGSAGASGSSDTFWWAAAPVSVTGANVDLGSLVLQPGMNFSGRVIIDASATSPPPDLAALRIQMQAASLAMAPATSRSGGPPGAQFLRPATVRADGTFSVTDLIPDDYQLVVSGPALTGGAWWLRAATWRDRDLLDAPIRVEPNVDVSGIALVLSDRHTELSGTLTTASGAPASDVFVIAYPAPAALRTPRSRRIQAVRPDSSGRFVIRNLPAGEYLIGALTDVDEGQWNDAGFLDGLVASSVKISLADGEKKVQDLQVGGSGGPLRRAGR